MLLSAVTPAQVLGAQLCWEGGEGREWINHPEEHKPESLETWAQTPALAPCRDFGCALAKVLSSLSCPRLHQGWLSRGQVP